MTDGVSLDESYDDFPRIEEAFGRRLDESLDPRGPASLWDEFERVEPQPGELVVDVGCGEGDDAVELATRFGLRVVGVDPVARHVELGTVTAERHGLADRVTFSLGSAEQMDVADGSVDIVWAKESLMYADLGRAFAELRRVLRPGGRVFAYQVFTGPRMTDPEAEDFWRGGAEARSVRPEDLASAATAAGFLPRFRSDLAGEWGEYAQERSGAGGRRLVHAARLLRDPDRYIAEFGAANYDVMLGDCLWHVYRMIGKLHGAVLAFDAPPRADRLFHIAYLDEWDEARTGADAEYRMSTKGRTLEEQGFIHASATRDQVERVGAAVYASETRPLVVLVVDPAELGAPIVAENLEGGDELFPHVYGPLPVRAVTATIPISTDGRRFVVDWDRPTAITEGRR